MVQVVTVVLAIPETKEALEIQVNLVILLKVATKAIKEIQIHCQK